MPDLNRAVGSIVAIAGTLFSNLTCDNRMHYLHWLLTALQYAFLQPCFLVIVTSLSCYLMRDSIGLVARLIIKIIRSSIAGLSREPLAVI